MSSAKLHNLLGITNTHVYIVSLATGGPATLPGLREMLAVLVAAAIDRD